MKIKTLTRYEMKLLRNRITQLLAPLSQEYGIKAELGNGRFDSHSGTFKLNLTPESAGNAIEVAFKKYAYQFGLDPEILGMSFQYQGQMCKIIGLRPTAHKYPVIIQKPSGIKRRLPSGVILAAIKQKEVA